MRVNGLSKLVVESPAGVGGLHSGSFTGIHPSESEYNPYRLHPNLLRSDLFDRSGSVCHFLHLSYAGMCCLMYLRFRWSVKICSRMSAVTLHHGIVVRTGHFVECPDTEAL